MTKPHIQLDLLEQIVTPKDERHLAEVALAALCDVSQGDHFSAILYDPRSRVAEAMILGEGWLPSGDAFFDATNGVLIEHPLVGKILQLRCPTVLVRSQEISNKEWHKSVIYNEVDRHLGVEDVIVSYHFTGSHRVLALSCGQGRRFAERDIGAIESYHRVLERLALFSFAQSGQEEEPRRTLEGASPASLLASLTPREHEILHWVREGKRDSEIGIILGISPRTAHSHLASIYRKLGVETRTAAAFFQ